MRFRPLAALATVLFIAMPLASCSAAPLGAEAACRELKVIVQEQVDKPTAERIESIKALAGRSEAETKGLLTLLAERAEAAEKDPSAEAAAIGVGFSVAGHCAQVGVSVFAEGPDFEEEPEAGETSVPRDPARPTSTDVLRPRDEVDCETATQAEWAEYCIQRPGIGDPFEYSSDTEWRVTLSAVECGIKAIPDAIVIDGKVVAARPEPGNSYCKLVWDIENVGRVPADGQMNAGNLIVGDEEFAASNTDFQVAVNVTAKKLQIDRYSKVNPRGKTKMASVYQIPEGEIPTGVWYPSDHAVLVDLTKTR